MTGLPEPLRLADALNCAYTVDTTQEAATELRRLHTVNERLFRERAIFLESAQRDTARITELEAEAASLCDQNTVLNRKLAELEQAGRQALEALEIYGAQAPAVNDTIAALRQALGGKHD